MALTVEQKTPASSATLATYRNSLATQLTHWRNAAAKAVGNQGFSKVVCIGDSTTQGYQVTGATYANNIPNSWPTRLAAMLTTLGVPATANAWFGDHNTVNTTNLASCDSRLTIGSSWTISNASTTFSNFALTATTNTNTLAFAPGSATSNQFDTIDIYYLQGASNGTFIVNVDGGSTLLTQSTSGSSVVAKATINSGFALGTHTVNITWSTGGAVFILGIATRNSTSLGVEFYNGGVGGMRSTPYGLNTSYNPVAAVKVIAPDLTIIDVTINDVQQVQVAGSLGVFQTNIGNAIVAGQVSGDVLLVTGNPTSNANYTNGISDGYTAVYNTLAAQYNVPVIDLVARWISFTAANALGYYGDSATHPSIAGQIDIARAILGLLGST